MTELPWKPKRTKREGPERVIQNRIVSKLRSLGWIVKETHGNIFQQGLPDIYAAKSHHGVALARWIEVKNPLAYSFTPAQREFFLQLSSVGIGVWILVDDADSEIAKLFGPANWFTYLEGWKTR